MIALLKKEINSFFASPIGYLVIALFLVLNGLFLWFFKGEFNILDYGFADLSSFFHLAPWILIFLIPAVTMRSFSDEKKQGTLELLLTKPISHLNIILGKYLGAFLLILLALLPTLIYVYTIYELGAPKGNFDAGSLLGSYFGLLFLIAAYVAIGIFASTLSDNQIVAFITAVFLCFVFYLGFDGLADFFSSTLIEQFGMSAHYQSMSRGVLDTRDLIYFLSVSCFFIYLTLNRIKIQRNAIRNVVVLGIGIVLFNNLANKYYERFDMTEDKRYTLSDEALHIIKDADSPLIVDVFLKGDDFPSEFRRLQLETRQILEEFSAENKHIKFSFIDPLEEEEVREENIQMLAQRGLKPMQLNVQESGKTSQKVIFPWALASYNDVSVEIPLIKNKIGASQQELVSNSVQHLEYAFADGFSKLLYPKRRKIAVLKGNGQLENRHIADFVTTLRDYYFIAPFTLDSVASNPGKVLEDIVDYDLIISAKPTEAFSEEEKLVLDQYTMQGGKSLWLVDAVAIDKDSLYNDSGSAIAVPLDLNLTDFFFKYGVRINPVMVNSLDSSPLRIAIGEGSETQFMPIEWHYSPLATSNPFHPITKNINYVKFDFANQIDTLKNKVDKTVLLVSSGRTKLEGVPKEVSLDMITKDADPSTYVQGNQVLAVLLEGQFTSVYNNRIKPFDLKNQMNASSPTKMVIVADGNIIRNDVDRNGRPLELDFDRDSGKTYGNKEFLLNAVNYLLDDNGLINIRTKEVSVAFLDQQKIADQKTKWQLINIVLPLVLLACFGFVFNFIRRRKFAN